LLRLIIVRFKPWVSLFSGNEFNSPEHIPGLIATTSTLLGRVSKELTPVLGRKLCQFP